MSKVDEELRGMMRRAERAPVVDGVFERLVRRRARKELARRASTVALCVVIIAAIAGGFLLAGRPQASRIAASTGSSPSVLPPGAPGGDPYYLPGVDIPVCDVSTTQTPYAEAPLNLYLFARGSAGKPCGLAEGGNAYLAYYLVGGPFKGAKVMGPIDCFHGCRAFGAFDVGGVRLMAVVVVDGDAADAIELYRIDVGSRGRPFSQLRARAAGKVMPFYFDWGGVGDNRAGASCGEATRVSSWPEMTFWTAHRAGGVWHVVESRRRIQGSMLVAIKTIRSTVDRVRRLPQGGAGDFCGSPVRP